MSALIHARTCRAPKFFCTTVDQSSNKFAAAHSCHKEFTADSTAGMNIRLFKLWTTKELTNGRAVPLVSCHHATLAAQHPGASLVIYAQRRIISYTYCIAPHLLRDSRNRTCSCSRPCLTFCKTGYPDCNIHRLHIVMVVTLERHGVGFGGNCCSEEDTV